MPSLNHIHTYQRHLTNKRIYICGNSYCSHYTFRELLINKVSLCNKCCNEFHLDFKQLRNRHPVCINCSRSKNKGIKKIAEEALKELFKETFKED